MSVSRIAALAKYIDRRVPADHLVVPFPDPPNMLLAPDILVGGDGRLSAIFVVQRNTSMGTLRARLISARLLLPVHTRMLLFLSVDRQVPYDLERSFDAIAATTQQKLLLPSPGGPGMRASQLTDLLAVRRQNNTRAEAILTVVYLRNRHAYKGRRTKTITRSLSRVAPSQRPGHPVAAELSATRMRPPFAVVAGTVVVPIGNQVGSLRARLGPIWKAGLLGTFSLDDGVPYPHSLRPHVALRGSPTRNERDPHKAIRSSAFAGWALVSADTEQDVTLLAERMHRFHERLQ